MEKTFDFSLKVIETYKYLIYHKKEFVMSKQLLRSATSIGANAVEADAAQSYKKISHCTVYIIFNILLKNGMRSYVIL